MMTPGSDTHTPEPPRSCPKCARTAVSGAAFCAFCAEPLPPEKASTPPRSVAVPDRSLLTGRCCIICQEDADVKRVGRLIAEAVGRPLPDVTRQLRNSKGFLAALDAPLAVALAEKLEQHAGTPVLVVPEANCVPLPAAMRMRHAAVGEAGICCEAYTWDNTEHLEVAWEHVFMVSCGRLAIQRAVEAPVEDGNRRMGSRSATTLVMETRYEFVMDIILRDPWRRLRLDQNCAAFSMTEISLDPDQTVGALYRSAMNIERFGQRVPANRALALLTTGASGAMWEPYTYLNKRDFDAYTHWLMQLVSCGKSIPE